MAIKTGAQLLALLLITGTASGAQGGGHARSFQHFHGPVYGEDKEVAWVDKGGKRHQDFAAPAHYEFAYGVEDHRTGDYHGQKEQRDGKAVAGEYTVKEPNGNIRTVKYTADELGFRATVHNSIGGASNTYGVDNNNDDDEGDDDES